MKESNGEGLANHSGPEPCEGGREAALEALDRGICRPGMELRNRPLWGADRERLGVLLPPVQILQPYPDARFDAQSTHIPGRNRVR